MIGLPQQEHPRWFLPLMGVFCSVMIVAPFLGGRTKTGPKSPGSIAKMELKSLVPFLWSARAGFYLQHGSLCRSVGCFNFRKLELFWL
jgi:hypothetical protein